MAINKQRLEKIKARQEVMQGIAAEARTKLQTQGGSPDFITKLIVQGLLMLLEKEVKIRCRKEDKAKVEGCLKNASKEYNDIIKKETGKDMNVNLRIDEATITHSPGAGEHVPCIGGVVLVCHHDKITIDNTIDSRLNLVMEQAKPNIRELLFPQPK